MESPVDFSFTNNAELQKLSNQAAKDPTNSDLLAKLLAAAEEQEGGINRNSNPQAVAALRQVYDTIVEHNPLYYGYFINYAAKEFELAGSDSATFIYERGVAANPVAVQLWLSYTNHKCTTTHDVRPIRELFERAVASCGLDFRSEGLWEAYIAFEEREGEHDTVFDIYSKLHGMPLYSYAAFHTKYIQLAATQPVENLVAPEVLEGLRREIAFNSNDPAELDRQLRVKIGEIHHGIFERTAAEVNSRWAFEANWLDYYTGTALEDEQMSNIMAYLDYMEGQGDYQQTRFLYERSLMPAANYEEVWFRYITWLSAQLQLSKESHTHGSVGGAIPRACSTCSGYPHKHETIRDVFQRACSVCVAVQSTGLRLLYARFEESKGRIGPANDIHEAVLQHHPSHTVTIKSLANMHRRQKGPVEAIEILRQYTEEAQCTLDTRGALVVEMARVQVHNLGDVAGARNLFERARDQFNACSQFWGGYLSFEIQQASKLVDESAGKHVKSVFQRIRDNDQLPMPIIHALTFKYQQYLEELGGKDAMAEILQLDTPLYAVQDQRVE